MGEGTRKLQEGLIAFSLLEPVQRIARHWFVFLLLVVVPALAVRGNLLPGFGLPLLLRDDPTLFEGTSSGDALIIAFFNSASFYTHAATTFLSGMFWLLAAIMGDRDDERFMRYSLARELWYLIVRTIPISAGLLLFTIFPERGLDPLGGNEILRCLAGAGAGLLLIVLFTAASRTLARLMHWPRRFVLFGALAALIVALHFWPKLIPIISIFKLAATIAGIYFAINFFEEGSRTWAFLLVVGLPLGIDSLGTYKYSFNGMERLYDCPVELEERPLGRPERPKPGTQRGNNCQGVPVPPARSTPAQALDSFKKRLTSEGRAPGPRLVVVVSSGGAYRATFWTALVLDRLRKLSADGRIKGLPEHIRLMTGASGGMVALPYFAGLSPAELDLRQEVVGQRVKGRVVPECKQLQSLAARIDCDIGKQQLQTPLTVQLRRDSLSDVLQQLAVHDVLHLALPGYLSFWPSTIESERGRVLQRHWNQLDTPFSDLSARVSRGEAPSLIFSPMIVETGQPLLISDLDLSDLADDPGLREQVKGEYGRMAEAASEDLPRHTIDFFRTFPSVFDKFTLQTAARMSATFPIISPAVDLPTSPPRRVVDAGYFDNYGMTTALTFLRNIDVRNWMRANNLTGALVVQINAYPVFVDKQSPEQTADCNDLEQEEGGRILQWLTTPLEGLESARTRSMVYRSEQALAALQELYEKEGLRLARVAFENTSRSSLNWYLPDHDLVCMQRELDLEHNNTQFAKVEQVWNDTGVSVQGRPR